MNEGKIILDNGGGVTLQMGTFAHYYEDALDAAKDLSDWIFDADTSSWEGHEDEAMECEPTQDEIRNGGYRVIRLDRDVDSAASLADEIRALGWGNAVEMADHLDLLNCRKAV